MSSNEPAIRAHHEWIGFLQPTGLVVSPPALVAAGAILDRNVTELQTRLEDNVRETPNGTVIADLPQFLFDVLGWEEDNLVGYRGTGGGGTEVPDELREVLEEYGDVLEPTYAVPDGDDGWLMLIKQVDAGDDLDRLPQPKAKKDGSSDPRLDGWRASHQARFDRLLRSKDTVPSEGSKGGKHRPIGLLCNGTHLRLVYAPRGESTGFITFPIEGMREVAGRPILAALHLLLNDERLFLLSDEESLPHILRESRKYQNEVSTELGEQVILALWELLRGFQAADEKRHGRLLAFNRNDPDHLYGGVLSTILRLVFVLYAEDNDLMPADPIYQEHYSVSRLFTRLRDDAGRFTDHMEQRFGAWPQLLTLFRIVHDGAGHGTLRLPSRRGQLFDPDAYPFLEGREYGKLRVMGDRIDPPRISDGVVYRVLGNLLVLKGERLSYRSLDVEQIGSVYEGMMGFTAEAAMGASIAVGKDHIVVNLDELLEKQGAARAKALNDTAGVKLSGASATAFKDASDLSALVAALGRRISKRTPQVIPPGGLYLQPTEERRRSGSHYTPRELTKPIVRTTLRPVLEQVGEHPAPGRILDLKVCDPAMGSGAFLVEACRQLGDHLVEAWRFHKEIPELPPDEDLDLHARRLVAQRCLYGVDKNPFAVNLAKMSLWLVTFAKDHPFTFVDHALRLGDSLVGLTREQLLAFDWEPGEQVTIIRDLVEDALRKADKRRRRIQDLGDVESNSEKRQLLLETDEALKEVRLIADLGITAFFSTDKHKARRVQRASYEVKIMAWLSGSIHADDIAAHARTLDDVNVRSFQWEVEFPEIFLRSRPGFDAVIGNPPFAGPRTLVISTHTLYPSWLREAFHETGGKCDLVAFFLRRSYMIIRQGGALGLITTKTIAQGDTRRSGLTQIRKQGGVIFAATKRLLWPGSASVIISIIHVSKPPTPNDERHLDGLVVPRISAFLLPTGGDDNPATLRSMSQRAFLGVKPGSKGFVFGERSGNIPLDLAHQLIRDDPKNKDVIKEFIGGREFNASPALEPSRRIIDFGDRTEEEAKEYRSVFSLAKEHVQPGTSRRKWWQHARHAADLSRATKNLHRVLAISEVCNTFALGFQPVGRVFSNKMYVFAHPEWGFFGLLQSRVHEIWVRVFASTLKDDQTYVGSDCFETFPEPCAWREDQRLRSAAEAYYENRSYIMRECNVGFTELYDYGFHDPEENDPGILKLRDLHDEMDRAVLDAYGWTDIRPQCEFLLDYEVEDDEPGKKRKKKPWRYRWPDDVRDEVLGRLLELNARYAEEERRQGAGADVKAQREREKAEQKAKASKRAQASDEGQKGLFE